MDGAAPGSAASPGRHRRGLLLGYLLAQPLAPGLSLVAVDDVRIYLAVAMLLAGAAFVASWWPARRAAAIDPIEALRGD